MNACYTFHICICKKKRKKRKIYTFPFHETNMHYSLLIYPMKQQKNTPRYLFIAGQNVYTFKGDTIGIFVIQLIGMTLLILFQKFLPN